MKLRYADKCRDCGATLAVGTEARYYKTKEGKLIFYCLGDHKNPSQAKTPTHSGARSPEPKEGENHHDEPSEALLSKQKIRDIVSENYNWARQLVMTTNGYREGSSLAKEDVALVSELCHELHALNYLMLDAEAKKRNAELWRQ